MAVAAVLLPNILYFLIAAWLGLSRPFFNVDYAIAATIFAFGRPRIGGLAALMISVIDMLSIVNQIYPFIRISDLFVVMRFLPNASSWHWCAFVGSLATLGVAVKIVSACAIRTDRKHALYALNFSLLVLVLFRTVSPEKVLTAWRVERFAWVSSEVLFFAEHRLSGNASKFFAEGDLVGEGVGAASDILDHKKSAPAVLLVVAESWGVFQDPDLADAVIRPLSNVLANHGVNIEQGVLGFLGSTVAAEFRELCRVSLIHLNTRELRHDMPDCLPALYKMNGYKTVAVHAAIGSTYYRRSWYPKVGFDEMRFKEDGRWTSKCRSFPGSCDSEIVAKDIRQLLGEQGESHFIYWLTLNSHQPYRSDDIRKLWVDCTHYGIKSESEGCRMVQLHAQFFNDLAVVLASFHDRSVEVLIVGDHVPPLVNAGEARELVKEAVVPWLHFVLGAEEAAED